MMFGRLTFPLGLTPFVACAALAPWTVANERCTGLVRDAAGQPRAGAEVVASPLGAEAELFAVSARATSDAQGRFELALEPGMYVLSTIASLAAPVCATAPVLHVAAGGKPAD